MRDFVSRRAAELKPSGIRRFFDYASERKDVISLGVGEPDFITPWAIREAGIRAVQKGYTQYTSNKGLTSLREEISAYLAARFNVHFPADNIVITVGASEAIDITLRAVIDEGDEVLVPDPGYVSYAPCVWLAGGVPVPVSTSGENGFKLTPEALESAITQKTKALIFPYPNNPTGGIMEREYIEKIVPVILKHDLLVITDEIYAELTYGKEGYCSAASIEELEGRVVLISGFSKSFAMTGWRMGWIAAAEPLVSQIAKAHQSAASSSVMFCMAPAEVALGCDPAPMVEIYRRRRDRVVDGLRAMGLPTRRPRGAFYAFPDISGTGMGDEEFCERAIVEAGVGLVPGSCFGAPGHVRLSFCVSDGDLDEALRRLTAFVS